MLALRSIAGPATPVAGSATPVAGPATPVAGSTTPVIGSAESGIRRAAHRSALRAAHWAIL